MSAGLGLLHKILTEHLSLTDLNDFGVTREDFFGKELAVYDMIFDYVSSYGTYPKLETVAAETKISFPDFPDEPTAYWVSKVDNRKQSRLILDASSMLTKLAGDGKLSEAKKAVRDLWLHLDIKSKADQMYGLSQAADEVVAAHDARQQSVGMKGVPFGLAYLDAVSDGAQGSDTVAICGRPSVGKSMFCLAMASYAWDAGETPLVVSMEMPVKQCARRIVALRTSIPATLIRLGKLSFFGRDKLVADVSRLHQLTSDHPFHLMQGSLSSSVEDLVLRVQELRPSALYVDGAYLLRSKASQDSRWERVAYTAEYLKMIATEFDIPVIATYQFNRRGSGSLGHIAFSDSIGMLASIVLGISDEDSENASSWSPVSFKIIELLKGREGEKGVIRCIYDMARSRILQDKVLKGSGMQALAGNDEELEE